MTKAWSVSALLRENAGRDPNDRCTIRTPVEVGVLAAGAFRDLLAYGRALGLTVTVDYGGGLLVRRGWLTARGQWGQARRFLREFDRLVSA
jgi:hypothetical protein